MVKIFVTQILKGNIKLENVPSRWQNDVKNTLNKMKKEIDKYECSSSSNNI